MLLFYSFNDIRRLGLPDSQSLHLLRPDLPFSTLPITSSRNGSDREGREGIEMPVMSPRQEERGHVQDNGK